MDKVRLAIVGTGGFAGVHARRLAEVPEAEIVALQDISEEQVSAFSDRWYSERPERPTSYTDMARMYAEVRPDGVVICTPHTLHFEHANAALGEGCHVLMEKPMVTDSRQAEALIELAKGRVFTIGYNTPCTPSFYWLREAIRSGEFGRLQVVTGWMSQDWKRFTEGRWRQDPALAGGGMMYDSGAHLFNSLVWTVERDVEAVHAFAANERTAVDINGTVNVRFQGGVMATVAICGNCSNDGSGMAFLFEDGLVEIDGWGGSWIRARRRGSQDPIEIPLGGPSDPDRNFIDAILGRAEPRTTPLNGLIQSRLMDAIYASARSDEAVRVSMR
jgi:predicted dehydrogenase